MILATAFGCQKRSVEALNGPSGLSDPQGKPNQVVFAGLSGASPRFIDSGPNRGLGWMERETREVRKALENDGFQIQFEYMTSARITHEFRAGNPICQWPVKWKDPKSTFRSKPDRIYSIPLNIEGGVSQKITFRKEDTKKFQKFLDKNGDVDIRKLLQDKSLKVFFNRDTDYGEMTSLALDRNEAGDQIVRPKFSDHAVLWLIRDHVQILEMLNAGRFDYMFDRIEAEEFAKAKIQQSAFSSLSFHTSKISSIEDPSLTLVSISCSIHPQTLQLMPFINRAIRHTRGGAWGTKSIEYRSRLDPTYGVHNVADTAYQSFRGMFDAGKGGAS